MVLLNGLRPEDVIALLPVNVSQEGEKCRSGHGIKALRAL